jgi:translation initiation factor IF-2
MFEITEKTKNKTNQIVKVAGCLVQSGELKKDQKFRILRDDDCLVEDLTIKSLMRF